MIKTRADYERARKTLEEVTQRIGRNDLSPAERGDLELMSYQLSGCLLSIWIPFGWQRRATMAVLFGVGLYDLLSGHYFLIVAWSIIAIFSPRIVGEVSFLLGRLQRGHP